MVIVPVRVVPGLMSKRKITFVLPKLLRFARSRCSHAAFAVAVQAAGVIDSVTLSLPAMGPSKRFVVPSETVGGIWAMGIVRPNRAILAVRIDPNVLAVNAKLTTPLVVPVAHANQSASLVGAKGPVKLAVAGNTTGNASLPAALIRSWLLDLRRHEAVLQSHYCE